MSCQDWRGVEDSAIGRQLRARRTAAGRTVASVAADAGLSVPYIANLENGRGNPTTAALRRLAEALDLRLLVTLAQAMGRDLAEADWWRLLDALLLIAAHPAVTVA